MSSQDWLPAKHCIQKKVMYASHIFCWGPLGTFCLEHKRDSRNMFVAVMNWPSNAIWNTIFSFPCLCFAACFGSDFFLEGGFFATLWKRHYFCSDFFPFSSSSSIKSPLNFCTFFPPPTLGPKQLSNFIKLIPMKDPYA